MSFNNIPNHLQQYIVDQEYERYTDIDHKVWSFIMNISIPFFKSLFTSTIEPSARPWQVDPRSGGKRAKRAARGPATLTVDAIFVGDTDDSTFLSDAFFGSSLLFSCLGA